jgi:primosomal protein N' (replication factor Y)
MTQEKWYFSEIVQQALTKNIEEKKKILLIVNKKWFASWLICQSCGHIPQCKQCSVSIGYHQADNGILYGLCPICKTIYDMPNSCEQCHKSGTNQLYGLTLQKTAQWIEENYKIKALTIDAEQVSSWPKATRILEQIKTHQIIISTNIIIPPENEVINSKFWILNWNKNWEKENDLEVKTQNLKLSLFDLIIVLAADQSLTLPDYTVRQNTFVQLYNLVHKFDTRNYIIQSYDTEHPSIRLALKQDRDGFFEEEKIFRSAHHYPPYGELCIIKYNSENESTLHNAIEKLHKELVYLQTTYEYHNLTMYTSSPLVYKKFWKYYYHIIIIGSEVRPFMDIAFSKLTMAKRWYKIDWMAGSLL